MTAPSSSAPAVSGSLSVQEWEKWPEEVFRCEADADCVEANRLCCSAVGINKKHLPVVVGDNRVLECPQVECSLSKPVCLRGHCGYRALDGKPYWLGGTGTPNKGMSDEEWDGHWEKMAAAARP